MAPSVRGRLAEGWALLGVSFVFLKSAMQLGVRGVVTMLSGMTTGEWMAFIVITALFVYGEGVRALQMKYMPYVLRRIAQLPGESAVNQILAPLYAFSLIGAERRVLVKAWAGTAAIVAAVIIVRQFSEPWRGIVDFGVAMALTWGLIALLAGAWKAGARASAQRR